jgi:hypothetical protein
MQVLFVLGLATLASWKSAEPSASPRALGGRIVVRVQLPDGSLPNVASGQLLSEAHHFGLPAFSCQAPIGEEPGLLRFDNIPDGKYWLIVRSQELTRHGQDPPIFWGFREDVSVNDKDIALVLTPGIKQEFLVKTSEGPWSGTVGVRCALRAGSGFSAPISRANQIVTIMRSEVGVEGRLLIDGLLPGEWTCVLAIPSYGRTGEITLTIPGEDPIEVVVPKFASLSGIVRAPEAISVHTAWVGVYYADTYLQVFEDSQVAGYTDKEGAFSITGVRPGHIKLQARTRGGGFRYAAEMDIKPGQEVKDLVLELVPRKEK